MWKFASKVFGSISLRQVYAAASKDEMCECLEDSWGGGGGGAGGKQTDRQIDRQTDR